MLTNNNTNSIYKKILISQIHKQRILILIKLLTDLQTPCCHLLNIISLSQERVEQQQGEQRSVNSRRGGGETGWIQGGKWRTKIIFALTMNGPFSTACFDLGVVCLCLCVHKWCACVCVSATPAPEETATFGPVMRPRRLVWSEKPVQICTAALCVSHSIWRPWVKGKRAGRSHLTAPLSCLWWWGRNKNGGTLCPWGQDRSIALWCVSARGDRHHSHTK